MDNSGRTFKAVTRVRIPLGVLSLAIRLAINWARSLRLSVTGRTAPWFSNTKGY
jgi:hypothetical protein